MSEHATVYLDLPVFLVMCQRFCTPKNPLTIRSRKVGSKWAAVLEVREASQIHRAMSFCEDQAEASRLVVELRERFKKKVAVA